MSGNKVQMRFLGRGVVFAIFGFVLLSGCDCRQGGDSHAATTNVVTVTREVVVTNTVTITVTNIVKALAEPVLSSRRTAPYVVSTSAFRGSELRKFLQTAGARILECNPGARAVIEAPEKVVTELRRGGVVTVSPMIAADKLAADMPAEGTAEVVILPISSIDCAAVAQAVRKAGGELGQVVTVGSPMVKAKLGAAAIRSIVDRGDVLAIDVKSEKASISK